MVSSKTSQVSGEYYTAVYVCGSLLLMMVVGLLFYVLCSRKYKLNWYEKSQLAAMEETGLNSVTVSPGSSMETIRTAQLNDIPESSLRFVRSASMGELEEPPSVKRSKEFWVPSGIKRQTSVCQEALCDRNEDDPAFAPTQAKLSKDIPASSVLQYVQPGTNSSQVRPKLTSMYSKLDHTKIDATMYQDQDESDMPDGAGGSIYLSISYNLKTYSLSIRVVEARNLIARDFSGTADPYAKVQLLPACKDVRQSAIHRKTLNPHFEEEFIFDLPQSEISATTIEVLIFDYDQYSRHQCMGNVQLPLKNWDANEKIKMWRPIHPCDTSENEPDNGDLMFSLGYLPSAERLTVVIMKARNLKPIDESKNTLDTYVKVTLYHSGRKLKKKKTSTQRLTLNPVFNEALTFNITKDLLSSITLEFNVVNESKLGQNEILGGVMIGPDSKGDEATHMKNMLSSKSAVAMWHILMPPDAS